MIGKSVVFVVIYLVFGCKSFQEATEVSKAQEIRNYTISEQFKVDCRPKISKFRAAYYIKTE